MELRQFISQSLQDIIGGIVDAQKAVEAMKTDAVVSPQTQTHAEGQLVAAGRYQVVTMVKFDVGVTVTKSGTVEGGGSGKITIWPFAGAEGEAKGSASMSKGHESRIAFEVPIALPRLLQTNETMKKAEAEEAAAE